MITLREQLKDPVFRKWFAKPPKPRPSAARSPEWFIYVQKVEGGPWKRGEVDSYKTGYKFIAKNIKKYHDMALSHKRTIFKPPVVRDKLTKKKRYHFPPSADEPMTFWCGFCRRITKFTYFRKHHAMKNYVDDSVRRCSICGARLEFVTRRFS